MFNETNLKTGRLPVRIMQTGLEIIIEFSLKSEKTTKSPDNRDRHLRGLL